MALMLVRRREIHQVAMLCLASILLGGSVAPASEAYVPADDAEVLDVLPTAVFARRDGIAKVRARLREEPNNPEVATTVARHYVGLGKSEGDPRFFGYARAALSPWWQSESAPPDVLRVRAKLKEINHRYCDALSDLNVLLNDHPGDEQAWVEVANINRVLGDYAAASEACDQLRNATHSSDDSGGSDDSDNQSHDDASLAEMVARVPLLAVTGQAQAAEVWLESQRGRVQEELPSLLPWLATMQGEIARGLGRVEAAEEHYQAGLASDPRNAYLKRAYSDFLIDRGHYEEVLELLSDDLNDNGALLRAAIAARAAGQSALADKYADQLRARFAETRLRGDDPHGRFEARYELEFGTDPYRALEIALANWDRQKEYRDARNVLEAAIAAGDASAAAPVATFLEQHGTEDADLDRLVRQLEDAS